MEEKIINFLDRANETDEVLPIQRNAVLQILRDIPPNIAKEYGQAIAAYLDGVLVWKNIIESIDRPNLCSELVDRLDKTQIEHLESIAMNLASKDPIEKIQELIELTFNLKCPSQENNLKTLEFIDLVKFLDIDRKLASYRFGCLSKRAALLADTFTLIDTEFEEVMKNRLSLLFGDELDRLIEMGELVAANNQQFL